MQWLEPFFWIFLFLLVYIYFGYLVVAVLLAPLYSRTVKKGASEPTVSILIAAYNEERNIRRTIENKLASRYPHEKVEIIVISDASADRTDKIVLEVLSKNQNIKFFRQEKREGKTAALNVAAMHASGEIFIFSDANSMYEPDALRCLVENFYDPSVGYVTGKMIYSKQYETSTEEGCSTYMKYENLLRSYETQIGSVVGVDGGIDAVRKSLFVPMRNEQIPDFILPLKVVEKGFRVVYEPKAILREPALASSNDEYKMRVRVTLRSLWALRDMWHLLNFARYGIFSWQLLSHKVLRYNAFFFLVGLWVVSGLLSQENTFYWSVFFLQTLFYLVAWLGYVLDKAGYSWKGISLPYYFTLINLATVHACWKFFCGEKIIIWRPGGG